VRYILPITVPVALAAAAGMVWGFDGLFARLLRERLSAAKKGAVAVGLAIALLVIPVAWAAARFHPYQLDYYNWVSGGPAAALKQRWFEFSWWGEGLAGCVAYVNRHGPRNARIGVDAPARHTMVLLPDMRTVPPQSRPPPDYLIIGGDGLRRLWDRRRHRWRHPPGYRVAYEERVAGVVLMRVYRLATPNRPPTKPGRPVTRSDRPAGMR
jgi:hypothetical protein